MYVLYFSMKNLLVKFTTSLFFSIYLFDRNNLIFASAALTFYFVLSLIPVFLIFISILNYFAFAEPEIVYELVRYLQSFNETAGVWFYQLIISTSDINPYSFGISGFFSLIFTSVLFSKGLFYSYYSIFQYKPGKFLGLLTPFLLNISLVFLVIGAVILKFSLLILNTFLNEVVKLDVQLITHYIERVLTAPSIIIFIMVTMSYYLLSGRKIKFFFALYLSVLFSSSLLLMNIFYNKFVNLNFYKVIYGQIGIIIFSLYWVYLVFALYLFFVQFGYSFVGNSNLSLDYCVKNLKSDKFFKRLFSKIFINNIRHMFVDLWEFLGSEIADKRIMLVSGNFDDVNRKVGDIVEPKDFSIFTKKSSGKIIVLDE